MYGKLRKNPVPDMDPIFGDSFLSETICGVCAFAKRFGGEHLVKEIFTACDFDMFGCGRSCLSLFVFFAGKCSTLVCCMKDRCCTCVPSLNLR